jgi:hypothetical protein
MNTAVNSGFADTVLAVAEPSMTENAPAPTVEVTSAGNSESEPQDRVDKMLADAEPTPTRPERGSVQGRQRFQPQILTVQSLLISTRVSGPLLLGLAD